MVLLLMGLTATIYFATAPADLRPRVADTPKPAAAPVATAPGETTAAPEHSDPAPTAPLAEPVAPGTRFTLEEGVARREYRITQGAVRFTSGGARAERQLMVRVGALEITDIGTVFTVETPNGAGATVSVVEGSVKVAWPGGQAILEAGQTGTFPPETATSPRPLPKAARPHPEAEAVGDDWRRLAREGRYKDAAARLADHPERVRGTTADQMLAADVMRLTGRPEQAVTYLKRVMGHGGADPRRSLAAFTLGRVYLNELGRPRQAAAAFARAGRGDSPLSEEALAREAEAWSRAGEAAKAEAAARRYVARYPKGPRLDVVKAFGGLNE